MVKVGFIVEGKCERKIIESEQFVDFLKRSNCELIYPVIDAEGGGNLLPKNIEAHINTLKKQNVEKIYILSDAENESVETVRERLKNDEIEYAFIAVKAIEAWFLADTEALRTWLDMPDLPEELYPEKTEKMPWDYLNDIAKKHQKRGTGTNKSIFTNRMLKYAKFSIERAAQHPNCPSAKELVAHFQNKVSQQ